jgi:hypothetical protein
MTTHVGVEDRSAVSSPIVLLQGAATCVGVTVLAYARMTGADPLFQFVWRSRIGSGLLFALVAAASVASVALVIGASRAPRERAVQVVSITVAAAGALAVGSVLLVYLSANPGEILRFVAAPMVLPLLVVIAVMNGLIWRRMEPIARYSCANWPLELFLALGAIASAVGVHLATNALGMEGFAIQALLVLLGAVAPALGFFTAFASLRLVERVASVPGLSAAVGSCAMIAVLSFL